MANEFWLKCEFYEGLFGEYHVFYRSKTRNAVAVFPNGEEFPPEGREYFISPKQHVVASEKNMGFVKVHGIESIDLKLKEAVVFVVDQERGGLAKIRINSNDLIIKILSPE